MNSNKPLTLQILEENKQHFTSKQYLALKTIAQWEKPFDYRKNIEKEENRIPYLPSFNQRVRERLLSIGLEIVSIPANDGTCCKLYALRTIKGFSYGESIE